MNIANFSCVVCGWCRGGRPAWCSGKSVRLLLSGWWLKSDSRGASHQPLPYPTFSSAVEIGTWPFLELWKESRPGVMPIASPSDVSKVSGNMGNNTINHENVGNNSI